jgi:hypothetical protein
MMRRAKRTRVDHPAALAEHAGDAVDIRDLKRFVVRHRLPAVT